MGATINTLATKDEIAKEFGAVRKEISDLRKELSKDIVESKVDNIKWMFVFWIGEAATTLAIVMLFVKK